MLRKFLLRFVDRKTRTLGFRIRRELDEIGNDILNAFGVTDYCHDYEDTWEWIEGESDERIWVNVSRSHNGKTGQYDVPVVVTVRGPVPLLDNPPLFPRVQRLANSLQTEIWIGRVNSGATNDPHYDFEIEHRFLPDT